VRTSDLLQAAWGRIDSPAKWTKNVFARDGLGNKVSMILERGQYPLFPVEALQFDSLASLYRANQEEPERGDIGDAMSFLKAAALSLSPSHVTTVSLGSFNDSLGSHAELKAWWEKAIKMARAKETY